MQKRISAGGIAFARNIDCINKTMQKMYKLVPNDSKISKMRAK